MQRDTLATMVVIVSGSEDFQAAPRPIREVVEPAEKRKKKTFNARRLIQENRSRTQDPDWDHGIRESHRFFSISVFVVFLVLVMVLAVVVALVLVLVQAPVLVLVLLLITGRALS